MQGIGKVYFTFEDIKKVGNLPEDALLRNIQVNDLEDTIEISFYTNKVDGDTVATRKRILSTRTIRAIEENTVPPKPTEEGGEEQDTPELKTARDMAIIFKESKLFFTDPLHTKIENILYNLESVASCGGNFAEYTFPEQLFIKEINYISSKLEKLKYNVIWSQDGKTLTLSIPNELL